MFTIAREMDYVHFVRIALVLFIAVSTLNVPSSFCQNISDAESQTSTITTTTEAPLITYTSTVLQTLDQSTESISTSTQHRSSTPTTTLTSSLSDNVTTYSTSVNSMENSTSQPTGNTTSISGSMSTYFITRANDNNSTDLFVFVPTSVLSAETLPSSSKNAPTTQTSPVTMVTKNTSTSGGFLESDSIFGRYGLVICLAMLVLCLLLLVSLAVVCHKSRNNRAKFLADEDKAVPKLKMLEIKDHHHPLLRGKVNDELHTYSLDYEKHVKTKIDENKKKKPPVAAKPIGGVSTFMLAKRPSTMSNSSSSVPNSPTSPPYSGLQMTSYGKAAQQTSMKANEDELVVFNFNKKPTELITSRWSSSVVDANRRKSLPSTATEKVNHLAIRKKFSLV